jgi:3-hydroxyisobutyrate dehydrogenase
MLKPLFVVFRSHVHSIAHASSTVVTVLPSSPQVTQVYQKGSSILEALRSLPQHERNSLFIDSTTLDVEVARGVAKEVIATGAQMIDAPVSGGKHKSSETAHHSA